MNSKNIFLGTLGTILLICGIFLLVLNAFIKDLPVLITSIFILLLGILFMVISTKNNDQKIEQKGKANTLQTALRTLGDFIGILFTFVGGSIIAISSGTQIYCLGESCSEDWSGLILILGLLIFIIGIAFIAPFFKDIYNRKKGIAIIIIISAVILFLLLMFGSYLSWKR